MAPRAPALPLTPLLLLLLFSGVPNPLSLLLRTPGPPGPLGVPGAAALAEFRAGVLMVNDSVLPFTMEMVGPAIDMAIERAEQEYGIRLHKYVRLYPTWCNNVYATGAIADLKHNDNIDVLIGPGCSGDITIGGKLSTYFRLPQVTGVGDLVLHKESYPTLTRLSYSLEKQGVFFTAILREFKWSHVAIIYDTSDVIWRVEGSSMTKTLREDASLPRPYDVEYDATKSPDFDAILTDVSAHARVILFLGSGDALRETMLLAHARGMTSGDYAFITIELFHSAAWGDYSWMRGDGQDEAARAAFEALLMITLTLPSGARWEQFRSEVIFRARRDYNFNYTEEVNYFVGAFYDGVTYLALALNRTLQDGEDVTDGVLVAQKLWNSTFTGIMGEVFIDEIGDKIADYSLLDMNLQDGTFHIVANYHGAARNLTLGDHVTIHWPGGAPPVDRPRCGFAGKSPECATNTLQTLAVTIIVVVVGLIVLAVGGLLLYRHKHFEAELANTSWRVLWEDVLMTNRQARNTSTSRLSLANIEEDSDFSSRVSALSGAGGQIFTTIGQYQGAVVAVRFIEGLTVELNRTTLLEVKMVRDLLHDNLTRFVGACIDRVPPALLIEYCPKGSLQDILANDAIKLDWLFRYSLINDIVRGMCYIHASPLGLHGRLKSSNCVVDSRFVLKLTDYGLPSFFGARTAKPGLETNYRAQFWTAPELLRAPSSEVVQPTSDVYSFGIILHEIISRADPYDDFDLDPIDVIQRVSAGTVPPFRPRLDPSTCTKELYHLVERCWAELPLSRPSFEYVHTYLKLITNVLRGYRGSKLSGNILDNLIARLEHYAENLEAVVEERTKAFLDEKKRSEELLYRVLPKSVAEQLKRGQTVKPEAFECVTIYFSDIVGFTAISAASSPLQVVDLLNDLYTCFDAIINEFDVYKVETIGDAYMVVSGLPLKNGDDHAQEIAAMSLALMQAADSFTIRHLPDESLKLRIGLHSGPCVAGVVGLTMPRYCLFGDTVNTASRMESNGEPSRIHLSMSTKLVLDKFNRFQINPRGEIQVKGKGVMNTYWLEGILFGM